MNGYLMLVFPFLSHCLCLCLSLSLCVSMFSSVWEKMHMGVYDGRNHCLLPSYLI